MMEAMFLIVIEESGDSENRMNSIVIGWNQR